MSLQGRDTPGLRTPGAAMPGYDFPGSVAVLALAQAGVAIDATGTTTLGTVEGDRDRVAEVSVNATQTDFNFQVTIGGVAVFDSAQTVSSTDEETFAVPVDAGTTVGTGDEDVAIEITSASGTTDAAADVTATVHSQEEL